MWPRLGARRLGRNLVFMKAENSRYVHKYRRYEGEHRRCDAEGQLGLWLELARASKMDCSDTTQTLKVVVGRRLKTILTNEA